MSNAARLHAEAAKEPFTATRFPIKVKNRVGEFVPCPPIAWRVLFGHRCGAPRCRRRFWTAEGYRGHYALVHILGLD